MVASSLFLLFVIFLKYIFLFMATMSYAGYFLVRSLLSAFPAYLRTYSRFDLVWFCLGVPGGRHDTRSLWGLYEMHETLWFCLVSGE